MKNFGFTETGVTQSLLSGKEDTAIKNQNAYFYFLKNVSRGLDNNSNVIYSDLFQVMNPDEILAVCAGYTLAAKTQNLDDLKLDDPSKVYSSFAQLAYKHHSAQLSHIKQQSKDRHVSSYQDGKGTLVSRISELLIRPDVAKRLSAENVKCELKKPMRKDSVVFGYAAPCITNRKTYANNIVKFIAKKYNSLTSRPVDFYLGELRRAIALKDNDSIDNLMYEILPVEFCKLTPYDENSSSVKEFKLLVQKDYLSRNKVSF